MLEKYWKALRRVRSMSDLVLVSLITATAAIGGPVVMHVISQRAARTEAQRLTQTFQ